MSVEVRMKVGDISAMCRQPNASTHSAPTNVNVNLDSGSTSLTVDSAQVKLSSVALYNEYSGSYKNNLRKKIYHSYLKNAMRTQFYCPM